MRKLAGISWPKWALSEYIYLIVLSLIALGNLILPASLQDFGGISYLLASMGILALYFLSRIAKLGTAPVAVTAIIGFAVLTLPAGLITEVSAISVQKVQGIVIAIVLMLAPFLFRNVQWSVNRLIWLVMLLAACVAIGTILFSQPTSSGRMTVLGMNPIGVARFSGLLPLTLLAFYMGNPNVRVASLVAMMAVATLGVLAVVTTGSRGPLIALAIASIGLYAALLVRRRYHRALRISLFFILGALTLIVFSPSLSAQFTRVLTFADSGRFELYMAALQMFEAQPFGIGWGGYGPALGFVSEDSALYPHNIFLELLAEGGILAFLGFMPVVLVAFRNSLKSLIAQPSIGQHFVLALLIYTLINAQFSSDIVGNRLLWLSLGLAVASPKMLHGMAHKRIADQKL